MSIENHRHEQRRNAVGGGEKWSELTAGNQLRVAQRTAALVALARRYAQRFAVGQARRNHTLVTVWSLVHPVIRLSE